jgi:hypothetical protein
VGLILQRNEQHSKVARVAKEDFCETQCTGYAPSVRGENTNIYFLDTAKVENVSPLASSRNTHTKKKKSRNAPRAAI